MFRGTEVISAGDVFGVGSESEVASEIGREVDSQAGVCRLADRVDEMPNLPRATKPEVIATAGVDWMIVEADHAGEEAASSGGVAEFFGEVGKLAEAIGTPEPARSGRRNDS